MVVCLTGCIYVFKNQIEHALYKDYSLNSSATLELDDSIETFRLQHGDPTKIVIPIDTNEAIEISSESKQSIGVYAYHHPYNGAILGYRNSSLSYFFNLVLEIHRCLLLQKTGKYIVGISVLLFVYLLLSGLIMWLPKRLKNLKSGLVIKSKTKFYRRNYDLHKVLGFYSSIFLLVIVFTGLYVSFHWFKNLTIISFGGPSIALEDSKLGKSEISKQLSSSFDALYADLIIENETTEEVLTIGALYNIVDNKFVTKGKTLIQFPFSEGGYYHFKRFKTGFFNQSVYDEIIVNEYGVIKQQKRFNQLALYEQFMVIVKPLHTGEIFGLFSAIVYFVVSLIASSLPITGFIIWQKRVKKHY